MDSLSPHHRNHFREQICTFAALNLSEDMVLGSVMIHPPWLMPVLHAVLGMQSRDSGILLYAPLKADAWLPSLAEARYCCCSCCTWRQRDEQE